MTYEVSKRSLRLAKGQPEIFALIAQNNINALSESVQDNIQTELRNDIGQTPLIFACKIGNREAVEQILNVHHDLNVEDFRGLTAHMVASKYEKHECLQLLLDAGVEPNYANLAGRTALMYACAQGSESSVKLLLEYGALVSLEDKSQRDALFYLKNGRDTHILKQFKRKRIEKLIKKRATNEAACNVKNTVSAPTLSFAELIGRQANSPKHIMFMRFFSVHFVMIFVCFVPLAIIFPGSSGNMNFAFPLSMPLMSLVSSLTYLYSAWEVACFKTTFQHGLPTQKAAEHWNATQTYSHTEYIQTLMDFQLKRLTDEYQIITDESIIVQAKRILAIVVLLGLLAITNLILWLYSGSPYTNDSAYTYAGYFAWAGFITSVIGLFLEVSRRNRALSRMHSLFDEKANLLLTSDCAQGDHKEFILYLRAFESTGKIKIGTNDFESSISRFLANRIILVTFGVPGEYAGAARVQSTEEVWQQDVLKLMHKAKHILMLPSDRPGTVWEAEQLKKHDFLSKTSFIMPPEMWSKSRPYSHIWQRAKDAFHSIGLHIPAHTAKGLVFTLLASGELHRFSMLQEAHLFVRLHGANIGGEGSTGDSEMDGNDGDGDGGGDGG